MQLPRLVVAESDSAKHDAHVHDIFDSEAVRNERRAGRHWRVQIDAPKRKAHDELLALDMCAHEPITVFWVSFVAQAYIYQRAYQLFEFTPRAQGPAAWSLRNRAVFKSH